MASENCAPGWFFSAALVNQVTAFLRSGFTPFPNLVERAHHGHGAGIAVIGQGFGNLAGGFEFLVLEEGYGFFKCGRGQARVRPAVSRRRSDRTYFIRPSVA